MQSTDSPAAGPRTAPPQAPGLPLGLSADEALRRLMRDGPNALAVHRAHPLRETLVEVVTEPMFLMLLAAGGLYLLLGERTDALMLLGVVFLIIGITVVQERRTEHALQALRELSSPRAQVLRDGVVQRIAAHELVEGDVILVGEGDRIPADALLRQATHLRVDESLLTGESVPVDKRPDADATALQPPSAQDSASLFAGTLVVAGQGVCEVMRTGMRTEFGRIGSTLASITPEPTPLMRQTRRMVRWMAGLGLLACAFVVVAYALTRGADLRAWRDGGLAGIAMAMAMLPEEFPVVLTVFLALGAWRLSRQQVLTRRLPAIETLGAATVLCVDKTGTLTHNRMRVAAVLPLSPHAVAQPEPAPALGREGVVLQAACLASQPQPTDPMDRALHAAWQAQQATIAEPVTQVTPAAPRELLHEHPLSAQSMAVVHLWRDAPAHPGAALQWLAAAKGAPEAVAALCSLDEAAHAHLQQQVQALARQGLRVLAVAQQRGDLVHAADAAALARAEPQQLGLQLIGLVAFEDPLREDVPAAVQQCREAGIRVVMITGDYPQTAQAIAHAAGLDDHGSLMTGRELDALSDAELAARIARIHVFARVAPQQKLRIVQALKACGEVVAMTGDGVNDAPALKAAHIGIAMGARGSDVAREAASLVLLDDAFTSIVEAVRQGRRIYANIRKAFVFILAVHVPVAGLSMLPVFDAAWPLLLLPVHIAVLELIIDPSCSLVFEAEPAEADAMRNPPRRADASLFSAGTVTGALLQGLSVLVACVAVYLLAQQQHSADAARGLTFATLVVGVLMLIVVNRASQGAVDALRRRRNPALWLVIAGTLGFLALVLTLPSVSALLRFAPLHPADLGLSLLAGVLCLLWVEWLKRLPWGRRWMRG
ncbi:MAG: cation-translocating P-type ATPase [Burkholderiaceae bacterium]